MSETPEWDFALCTDSGGPRVNLCYNPDERVKFVEPELIELQRLLIITARGQIYLSPNRNEI